MGYRGGESIGGDGSGSGDVYKGKTESALVSVSDSYSEDEEISVCDSGALFKSHLHNYRLLVWLLP